MTNQDDLVSDILDGFVPIDDVPDNFAAFVQERIAARPSPDAGPSQMDRVESKLDEILTLLRGGE